METTFKNKVALSKALATLQTSESPFLTFFTHGSLDVELYQPHKVDLQQPHDRDEVYIIASGRGDFFLDGETTSFKTGDFLFAAAGKKHRFLNFTEDFSTWVLFYGSVGGETDA